MRDYKIFWAIEKELRKCDVWKNLNQKEFIYKLFKDKYPDSSAKTLANVYSTWKNYKVNEISMDYRRKISDIIGFDIEVWDKSNISEIQRVVVRATNNFLKPILTDNIIIDNPPMNKEQKSFLKFIKKQSIQDIESILNQDIYSKYFTKSKNNQTFLLEFMDYLYKKGLYELLYDYIIPNITSSNYQDFKVQKIFAYTLGSLKRPRYNESLMILKELCKNYPKSKDISDLCTSYISAIRRNLFSEDDLDNTTIQKYILELYQYYLKVFENKPHYYSGINLAYIISLGEYRDVSNISKSVEEVYIDSKKSILNENSYYANISDIEFRLLLSQENYDYNHNIKQIFIENKPSFDNIYRTKRQIEEFISLTNHKSNSFITILKLLDEYLC